MKKCPYCGKKYSDEAERCALDQTVLVACTNEDVREAEQAVPCKDSKPSSGLAALGWLLILGGIVGTLYFAFGFSTAAPGSDIVNIGLQQDRLLGFIEAQVNFLAGLLILLFSNLKRK